MFGAMVLFLRFITMMRAGPVERDKSGSEGADLACGLPWRPVTYGAFHFPGKILRVKHYTFFNGTAGHQKIAFAATTKRKKIQTPSDA
jgi:hypothetical protein